MAVTLGYSGTLSNVTIAGSVLGSDATYALVERSSDGGTTYTQVRGAAEWPVSSSSFTTTLNDYEFSPNEVNTYRVTPYDGANFPVDTPLSGLILDGTSGDYASTPDAASLDIVGDLELMVEISARDWTPASDQTLIGKWTTTGNQRSYRLKLEDTGHLSLMFSTNGTAETTKTSTAVLTIPASGRLAVRATIDVNNGAAGYDVKFYTASSIGGTWTQLGTTVTTAVATSIFSSSALLTIGGHTDGTAERFTGVVHAAKVLSGLAGTEVANPNFTTQTNGATSFADTATPAKTWTVQGAAELRVIQSNTTTPTITAVWLKSPLHPFLNRSYRVVGFGTVTRQTRSGMFDVKGRSYPVTISELRGTRRFEMTIRTTTRETAEDADLILASGDVFLLQMPPDTGHVWLPANIYVEVEVTTQERIGLPASSDYALAEFKLACVEVAPPDPDVYGSTATWATILAGYADWADLIAAFSDWGDVMDLVGNPEDVVVP